MEQAAICRRAARDAVQDIFPDRLQADIDDRLSEASMVPGALALLCARSADDAVDLEGVADRAAGVQLIYEGLRLTRTLAHEEPWIGSDDQTDANMDILAADVFVSRGFYLLARTEAATKAVETVQAFGRDQTLRRDAATDADRTELDGSLERNVLELAVIAGVTATGTEPSAAYLAIADDLATEATQPFEVADVALANFAEYDPAASAGAAGDGVRTSATDP